MRSMSRTVPVGCEHCGHLEVRATIKREFGAGAELLIECPACGHEEWSEMSEATVQRIPELLAPDAH